MTHTLDLAIESSGQTYLNLELDLRHEERADPSSSDELRNAAASHPDPVARLLAQVVLDWAGHNQDDFKAALAFLDYVPTRFKRTALGFPRPSGVEAYLTDHFEDRVAELMALRLCKEAGWPHWKVVGIIFYLEAHKKHSTTSALIRFALETSADQWRRIALDAIRTIGDPELRHKLAFEIARARKHGLAIPTIVRDLAD